MPQQSKLEMGRLWKQEEVIKLCEYVSENGPSNWKLVAAYIGTGRTANSCRQRWFDFHQSGVRKEDFTDEEMLTILLLHSKCDGRWAKITGDLPGRTSNQIKNFWNTTFKKEVKEFPQILILGLVDKIHAAGKSLESSLPYNAFIEWLRLYTEAEGGTSTTSSLTAPVYYPGVSELMPPEISYMNWEHHQQNEWPELDHNGGPVTGIPVDQVVVADTTYDLSRAWCNYYQSPL